MTQTSNSNGNGLGKVTEWPDPIVISAPDSAFETAIIPLDDEWRQALTANVDSLPPPPRWLRCEAARSENKPPRLPRPANLRWWERLAYAWRGL